MKNYVLSKLSITRLLLAIIDKYGGIASTFQVYRFICLELFEVQL